MDGEEPDMDSDRLFLNLESVIRGGYQGGQMVLHRTCSDSGCMYSLMDILLSDGGHFSSEKYMNIEPCLQ